MKSTRVLLSDKHFHKVELSEQQIGIIEHALDVLTTAFDCELEYERLIKITRVQISSHLEQEAYTDPLNPPR